MLLTIIFRLGERGASSARHAFLDACVGARDVMPFSGLFSSELLTGAYAG
jgi:hypothetical protein